MPSCTRPAFDILAPLYDTGVCFLFRLVGSEKRLRGLTINALDIKEGDNILEVCCGTGTLALMAEEKGAKSFGIDISMGMLKTAKKKSAGRNQKADFILANAESVPFKKGSFDKTVVSMGLHEMPLDAVKNTIHEIKRVLKDGSKFVIFDYHKPEGFIKLLQRIFFVFTEHKTARDFIAFAIEKEMRDAGFKNFRKEILAKGALQLITCEI
ncbi:MAG: hypothetical protein A2073_04150 [Deltaproteobacteria bacterium GWC2_42_11]|nr:MAG: hypothetical protein A2073_04150 [Deltaproteobacteria bacterium GWC2_42_11]HBO83390.1 hypothetical protein [Deltaproteobacteria bacterium]